MCAGSAVLTAAQEEVQRCARERKTRTCFRCLLGGLPRRARGAGDEARRFGAELEGHREISLAAGLPRASKRMGSGFCAGGAGRARRAGVRLAYGAVPPLLPGSRAL